MRLMLMRRLLWLVAALLVVAAITALLAPRPEPAGPVDAVPPTPRAGPGGERATVTEEVDAAAGRPRVVRAREGDRVVLTVKADRQDVASVDGTSGAAGLDRVEPVSPVTPARFDFVASRAGTYEVRLRDAARTVGELRVRARASANG